MISGAIAVLVATLGGASVARRVHPEARLLLWLGESVLFGFGLVAIVLMVLGAAGIPWSLSACLIPMGVIALLCFRRERTQGEALHPLDALTVVVLAGYARLATAAPPWELDFLAIWGLKGRVFALHHGFDWAFLQNGWYAWSHQDYPPLLPLSFDFLSLFAGGWSPAAFGLFYVAMAIAGTLAIRSLVAEELQSSLAGAIGGLCVVCLMASPWVGLADAPLVAYITVGALLIRREQFLAGSLLLGCAALTKNEGLTFLIAIAFAMLLDPALRPRVPRLWPALVIPVPWLILRAVHGLATDLTSGPVVARVIAHFQEGSVYASGLWAKTAGHRLLFLGIALALAAAWPLLRRERFLLTSMSVQVLFYLGAYLVTPLDVASHIRWSWDRLLWHVTPVMVFVALIGVLPLALGSTAPRHPEPAGEGSQPTTLPA